MPRQLGSTALGLSEKRSGSELQGLRDSADECQTDLRWCHSDIQLADCMTKAKMSHKIFGFLRRPRWKFVLDSSFTSAVKHKAFGLKSFDDMPTAEHDSASAEFLDAVFRVSLAARIRSGRVYT